MTRGRRRVREYSESETEYCVFLEKKKMQIMFKDFEGRNK